MSDQTATPRPRQSTGRQTHRRETRVRIALPLFLAGLFVLVLVLPIALSSVPLGRTRAQAMADWSTLILCTIPLCLTCVFPLFFVSALGAWGVNQLHDRALTPLERLEQASGRLADRFEKWNEGARKQVGTLVDRIHPVLDRLNVFDPAPANDEGEDHE